MIAVVWSLTDEDDVDFSHPEVDRLGCDDIADHMNCAGNAEAAAAELVKRWVTEKWWTRTIGDDSYYTVLVEIHEPAEIAGRYAVDLSRTIEASATKKET